MKASLRSAAEDNSSVSSAPLLYLIARKWRPIPLSSEYRVFVCKRQVTAAAQYFAMCYWPEIVQNRELTQVGIKKYVDHIVSNVVTDYENCVVDVCLYDDAFHVIEINPFHFSTGAPLYGWKQGSEDRKHLLYGPYELRVRTEAPKDAKERFMATPWINLFDQKRDELTGKSENSDENHQQQQQQSCSIS